MATVEAGLWGTSGPIQIDCSIVPLSSVFLIEDGTESNEAEMLKKIREITTGLDLPLVKSSLKTYFHPTN